MTKGGYLSAFKWYKRYKRLRLHTVLNKDIFKKSSWRISEKIKKSASRKYKVWGFKKYGKMTKVGNRYYNSKLTLLSFYFFQNNGMHCFNNRELSGYSLWHRLMEWILLKYFNFQLFYNDWAEWDRKTGIRIFTWKVPQWVPDDNSIRIATFDVGEWRSCLNIVKLSQCHSTH